MCTMFEALQHSLLKTFKKYPYDFSRHPVSNLWDVYKRLSYTWITSETGSRRAIKTGDDSSEIPASRSRTAHVV